MESQMRCVHSNCAIIIFIKGQQSRPCIAIFNCPNVKGTHPIVCLIMSFYGLLAAMGRKRINQLFTSLQPSADHLIPCLAIDFWVCLLQSLKPCAYPNPFHTWCTITNEKQINTENIIMLSKWMYGWRRTAHRL